jgi:hypothetical protein
MFDLEKSIADWRRQMLAAGIKLSAVEELESHLREEVERQVKSGQSPQSAFDLAVKSIGPGVVLKREFRRSESLAARFTKLMGIGCGAVAVFFSLWIFSFLLLDATGVAAKTAGVVGVVIIFMAWKYGYKFLPAIPWQPVRSMIGLACCIGSVILIQLFIKYVLTDMVAHPARVDMPDGRVLALFQWAWTAMAVLCSVGYGLEKAACEREIASR